MGRRIKITIYLLLFTLISVFTSASIAIYRYSQISHKRNADVAIVLGAASYGDQPSPVLKSRIRHAIELYKNKKIKFLIFTGGVGKNKSIAESEVSRKMAIKAGVPGEHIYVDLISTTTLENLREANRIMRKFKMKSALLVSDPYHMKRSISIALKMGISAYSSPTPYSLYKSWQLKTKMILREAYYYLGYLFNSTFRQELFRL